MIFLFDHIADSEKSSESVDMLFRDLILAFGILIGFCWEHAFHVGVEDLAAHLQHVTTFNGALTKVCVCVAISGIVLPAYRLYIMPTVFRLTEEKEEKNSDG